MDTLFDSASPFPVIVGQKVKHSNVGIYNKRTHSPYQISTLWSPSFLITTS